MKSITTLTAAACAVLLIDHSSSAFVVVSSAHRRPSALRATGDDGMNAAGELVSTLAKLDNQWQIQQSKPQSPKSRWSRRYLDKSWSEEDDSDETTTTSSDYVYFLEPPSSIPSSLIVFIGGAGLGQFPHIAYDQFLTRISDKLNAAVVAAPYSVGLNHFEIAKQAGELLRLSVIDLQDNPATLYSETLPTYCLAHSLGCKLATIYMGATGQDYDGIGFVSFNNFSFSSTIGMAKEFAQLIRQASEDNPDIADPMDGDEESILNQIFSFAETVVGGLGVEFTPNAAETMRLMEMKYGEELQEKTRLFSFDDDKLDNSQNVKQILPFAKVSGLPGTHLSPVFLKFGVDEMPREAQMMASQTGYQGASFGDEKELNGLVQEFSDFVLGKEPSRGPAVPMQIAGSSEGE